MLLLELTGEVQIGLAVEYLHKQNILHRVRPALPASSPNPRLPRHLTRGWLKDLKPANILLKTGDLVKLGDFGGHLLPICTAATASHSVYNCTNCFLFVRCSSNCFLFVHSCMPG